MQLQKSIEFELATNHSLIKGYWNTNHSYFYILLVYTEIKKLHIQSTPYFKCWNIVIIIDSTMYYQDKWSSENKFYSTLSLEHIACQAETLTSPEDSRLFTYSKNDSSFISLSVKMKVIPCPSCPAVLYNTFKSSARLVTL